MTWIGTNPGRLERAGAILRGLRFVAKTRGRPSRLLYCRTRHGASDAEDRMGHRHAPMSAFSAPPAPIHWVFVQYCDVTPSPRSARHSDTPLGRSPGAAKRARLRAFASPRTPASFCVLRRTPATARGGRGEPRSVQPQRRRSRAPVSRWARPCARAHGPRQARRGRQACAPAEPTTLCEGGRCRGGGWHGRRRAPPLRRLVRWISPAQRFRATSALPTKQRTFCEAKTAH
ncbi:hypothetical protein R8510_04694 [Ralstonia chuxiongensis]|nr:hypothetical protein R8510_04694 [Ralstonia chuxiongensis]